MLPQHIEIKDALWNNLSFKSEGKNFEIFVCRFFHLKTKLRTRIPLDTPFEFLVTYNGIVWVLMVPREELKCSKLN